MSEWMGKMGISEALEPNLDLWMDVFPKVMRIPYISFIVNFRPQELLHSSSSCGR